MLGLQDPVQERRQILEHFTFIHISPELQLFLLQMKHVSTPQTKFNLILDISDFYVE